MTFLILSKGVFMQLFDFFEAVFKFSIDRVYQSVKPSLLTVNAQFMLDYFGIDFLV